MKLLNANLVRRRQGSVYLPILLISSVAATLSIGGLMVVQSHSRAVQLREEAAMARANALSGIEVARAIIFKDNQWRNRYSNGTWISSQLVSATEPKLGKFSVSVVNPAGALNRADTDVVTITGTGTSGNATQTISVVVEPAAKIPLTCLDAGVAVAETITFNGGKTEDASAGIISANGDIANAGADTDVKADVESSGVITGRKFKGSATIGVAKRAFPESTVFDQYPSATAIPLGSLASYNGTPSIRNCVLSPANNPFGTTNSRGIYVIDLQGAGLIIRQCRIVGTLIVKNAGYVSVQGNVNWYPAETTLPALLVQGRLTLEYTGDLKENNNAPLAGGATVMNFNPAGTPYAYPGGTADTDTTDTYPSYIGGLIYSSYNVGISAKCSFHSLVVGGALWIDTVVDWKFNRDSTYYTNPPPGFYTMRHPVLAGTYK